MSKLEKVVIGLIIGGAVGGFVGAILGKQPPLTLNPENPSPLDQSNEGFSTLGGIGTGSFLGAGIALASE